MTRHYIAGSGEYGCLYDNAAVLPTKGDAIDFLCDLFAEDNRGVRTNLRSQSYADLENGADYCEIAPCECDCPEAHDF
jgi:hypothetical protein